MPRQNRFTEEINLLETYLQVRNQTFWFTDFLRDIVSFFFTPALYKPIKVDRTEFINQLKEKIQSGNIDSAIELINTKLDSLSGYGRGRPNSLFWTLNEIKLKLENVKKRQHTFAFFNKENHREGLSDMDMTFEELIMQSSLIEDYSNPCGENGKPIPHRSIPSIFSKPLSRADIKQGELGDCNFLSSVAAILALPDGQNIIKSMFIDQGDKVIVRLFDENTPELKPRFIRIDKSIPIGTQFNKSAAPWVLLIEKAFVASHKGNYHDAFKVGRPTHLVLRALTGIKESGAVRPMNPRKYFPQHEFYYKRYGNEFLFYELMSYGNETPENFQEKIIQEIFHSNPQDFNHFCQFIKLHQNTWEEFIKNKNALTISEMNDYFSKWKDRLKDRKEESGFIVLFGKVMTWLNNHRVLQDRPYSPNYTPAILQSFEMLREKFEGNQPIVIDSQSSRNEGIDSGHAYAVVGFEKHPKTGFMFVRVKNPQNRNISILTYIFSIPFGRQSIEAVDKFGNPSIKIEMTSSSEFLMEYTDFLDSFPLINVGLPITAEKIKQHVLTSLSIHIDNKNAGNNQHLFNSKS